MTYAANDGGFSAGDTTGVLPELSDEHAECLQRYGAQDQLAPGQVLYSRGDENFDFYFLREGTVNVYHQGSPGESEEQRIVTVYGSKRQFTGELSLLNRQKSLVDAVAVTHCTVIRLRQPQLRRMIANEPEIARTILKLLFCAACSIFVWVSGPSFSQDRPILGTSCAYEAFSNEMNIRFIKSTPVSRGPSVL